MGLLRRLFGGSVRQQLNMVATFFSYTRDDAVVHVVGEAYRQRNLADARPPGPDDLPPGLPAPAPGQYKAMLVRDPTNQYDSNAVMVLLWAGGDWTMTGYLSRGDAIAYRPLFDHLQGNIDRGDLSRAAISCDAAMIPERDGRGVVLHLGSPGECAADIATADLTAAPDHPWKDMTIVFTGQMVTTIHGVPIDRNAQAMLARWAGCTVLPRLTKKSDALIVADLHEVTANLQKAKEYGVPIVSEPDFLVRIGLPADVISKMSGRWVSG